MCGYVYVAPYPVLCDSVHGRASHSIETCSQRKYSQLGGNVQCLDRRKEFEPLVVHMRTLATPGYDHASASRLLGFHEVRGDLESVDGRNEVDGEH